MIRRFFIATSVVVAAAAFASLKTAHVHGQSQTQDRDAEATKKKEREIFQEVVEGLKKRDTAAVKSADLQKNWKPGRTAWGDPDLSGVYSNSDEANIPFERPARFEGRRLEDITPAELAQLQQERQNATIERAVSASDDPHAHPQLFFWETLNAKNSRAWLITDPPDGKIPPLTPDARRRAADLADARRRNGHGPADGPEDRSLYDRCISRGLPGSMMPAIYGSSYEIVQGQGYVAIVYEMVHETRVIPLLPRPRLNKTIRTYMGDARGHWEGNTLVVETTNFKNESAYRGANGDTLRLVERLTAVGPNAVEWSVTVDDPSTWTMRWTFAMSLSKKEDSQRPFEYACHEGNYAMSNILSGARADERAIEDAIRNGRPIPQSENSSGTESER